MQGLDVTKAVICRDEDRKAWERIFKAHQAAGIGLAQRQRDQSPSLERGNGLAFAIINPDQIGKAGLLEDFPHEIVRLA